MIFTLEPLQRMDSEGVNFEAKKPGRLLQQEEGLNLTGVMGM